MGPLWKPAPRAVVKKAKQAQFKSELNDAYAVAEKEQRMKCWVTGVKLSRSSLDYSRLMEHHHLEERSLNKGRRTDPTNIVLLSKTVHQLVTGNALYLVDAKGDKALRCADLHHVEWNRTRVAEGEEPIRVRTQLRTGRRRGVHKADKRNRSVIAVGGEHADAAAVDGDAGHGRPLRGSDEHGPGAGSDG